MRSRSYRDPVNRASILASLNTCSLAAATIQMIGVWDTVGSLGFPAIFGGADESAYGFVDTGLHPDIKNGYSARRPGRKAGAVSGNAVDLCSGGWPKH
jgi:hypothetical protein